jgi:hypothetical protein
MNIAIGAMMGLAFFVATFITLWHFWRFGGSADPLATA